MNRLQQRRFLRSKLGDMHPTSPKFSDSDLNLSLLNSARIIQNWVNVTDPNPYTVDMYGDIQSGEYRFPLPGDYRSPGVREVAMLINGVYTPIRRLEFNELNTASDRLTASSETQQKYAIGGGYLRLKITPTANVTAGIRIEYAAQVSYGDDDTAIIQLPLELHPCIYLMSAADLSQDLGYTGWKDYYTFAKLIYDGWAEGFNTTIGPDGQVISNVGNLNKVNWPRA